MSEQVLSKFCLSKKGGSKKVLVLCTHLLTLHLYITLGVQSLSSVRIKDFLGRFSCIERRVLVLVRYVLSYCKSFNVACNERQAFSTVHVHIAYNGVTVYFHIFINDFSTSCSHICKNWVRISRLRLQ